MLVGKARCDTKTGSSGRLLGDCACREGFPKIAWHVCGLEGDHEKAELQWSNYSRNLQSSPTMETESSLDHAWWAAQTSMCSYARSRRTDATDNDAMKLANAQRNFPT